MGKRQAPRLARILVNQYPTLEERFAELAVKCVVARSPFPYIPHPVYPKTDRENCRMMAQIGFYTSRLKEQPQPILELAPARLEGRVHRLCSQDLQCGVHGGRADGVPGICAPLGHPFPKDRQDILLASIS